MNPNRYLERIGWDGPDAGRLEPDADTLRRLHRRHLFRAPFENLDIHLKRRFTLDIPAVYDKIVARRRGGFCYELNGAFAWLLGELGFDVTLLSARVFGADGEPGEDFDHLALLVRLEERWLADVGFGDNFLDPLKLDSAEPQLDGLTTHRLVPKDASTHVLERWLPDRSATGAWTPQYVFTTRPREMAEFDEMCVFHQTSPESHFTKKRVCTLARPDGRITLAGLTLIETVLDERTETELAGEAEWAETLRQTFGVVL